MFNYYLHCLQNYANFKGRARRMEYWSYALFNAIFGLTAVVLDNLTGLAVPEIGYGPFYGVFLLATLIPGIAVFVRRLHDTGRSGWSFFVAFIPLIGTILILIWTFSDSKPGANKWGPNPKE